jgi:hypothetical protein
MFLKNDGTLLAVSKVSSEISWLHAASSVCSACHK